MPRSLRLASHTASSLSVLGRPGRCLTSRALTSHTVRPRASSRYNQARQESEVDSTTTRWIPWQASCSASSMIVLGVAGTCHTLVMRRPGLAGCGTRVHTIPDALATSIAATRATSSSGSSTSTMSLSTVSPSWATSLPPAIGGVGSGLPGSPVGTGTLTGVLKATVRDPAVGPRRQTESRPPTTKHASASAGNPTHFRAHATSPRDTSTDPKIHGGRARGCIRAPPGSDQRGAGCPVTAGQADAGAPGAVRADAGVVEAGAEVVEPYGRVGQQMPDDDQNGPADRDDRSLLAASTGDPPVAFTEEGIGLAGGDGDLPEHATQVGVAVPGRSAALGFAGGLADAWGELGPGDQVPGGWEPGHVRSDLGDEQVRGGLADPRDLIQPVDRVG